MRPMETIHDLIEEAKIRLVWWAICIFAITYFLAHTSKSMWMNVPIAVLIAVLLRILTNEVDFRWKVPSSSKQTYLSYLERKQLPLNDYRLSSPRPQSKWKRKFDSPMIEAAVEDFIDKIIQDFVTDLWYSDITPDKETPELMHTIILDALGEVAGRVKEVNLVDLLTRDLVDLIGEHLELFRRTQASIGVDVMVTLSSEERDERLKHHLMASNELHPALISAESEYKILQRLVAGLLALVLRPRDAQCPLVRCIAREFVTCLVIQPILNLVTPAYINELLEFVLLHVQEFLNGQDGDNQSSKPEHDHPGAEGSVDSSKSTVGRYKTSDDQLMNVPLVAKDDHGELTLKSSENLSSNAQHAESLHAKADWARVLDAATQRRTEVLAPENLENMWAIGRNYKDKINKSAREPDNRMTVQLRPGSIPIAPIKTKVSHDVGKASSSREMAVSNQVDDGSIFTADGNKSRLKRSNSTSDLKVEPEDKRANTGENKGLIISEDFYSPDIERLRGQQNSTDMSTSVIRADGSHFRKLRCRVIGAYFEKIGSKSFAVYSIAVTDAQNNTWFVKRRYRNFERLHRHLKDIPNYNLHLPPKRIFSSSTEDAFVHRRCIKLDRYLQDLLSIPNVAEQHEVWDFLSTSSKNYSFGKSSSEMQTLAVNVDDAVDDIVRQFKGVPDGLLCRAPSSSSGHDEDVTSVPATQSSLNEDDFKTYNASESSLETAINFSDNEEGDKDESHDHDKVDSGVDENGWHSDNELNSKSFPRRVFKQTKDTAKSCSGQTQVLETKSNMGGAASLPVVSHSIGDHVEVPPEWTPPNVTVPVLNLVDKVFQLNKRGWIRRQVFWISRQILQLVMEDAVDDWLLGQINWLRKEEVVAQGIRWVKDILWPDGKFFLKLEITGGGLDEMVSKCFQATPRAAKTKSSQAGLFEMHLEAARRASYIRNVLFHGAPAPLVGFVGQKQYKRCARDIYFFLQVAYAILELLLVSVFPELKDVVADIHPKTQAKAALSP
uniref:PX domain-containing protein n=1 Tax=Opuntia streptacantha TaxID=393608 RepID=A0A7C9E8S9_OPUST